MQARWAQASRMAVARGDAGNRRPHRKWHGPPPATSGDSRDGVGRVLKLTRQSYYRWRGDRVRDADVLRAYRINALHDDPTFGYRYLADEARRAGWRMSRRTAWRLCSQAGILSSAQRRRRGKGKKAGPPSP
ncbi:hypothetical protein MTsN4n12_30990 [Microbacterium sp. MTN4-12]